MIDPRQCETFLETAKDIIEFIEQHEREDSGMLNRFAVWTTEILEDKTKKGQFEWPALIQLYGPHPLYVLDGPRSGQTCNVYSVRYITAPTKNVTPEDMRDKVVTHCMAFIVEDNELVEYIADMLPN